MFGQIASFLVDTLVTLFVFLLLLRFHFQWLRVPFRNPVGEFVLLATGWIVLPARRVIPGLRGLDLATLSLAWALQALGEWILFSIAGRAPGLTGLALVALVDLLRYSLYILIGAVIIQVVFSWINPYTPAAPVLDALTRPFLRPLRRYVPPIGSFDLTPLVLVVLVQVVLIVVWHLRPAVAGL
ncbi:MAG TPA: YggT family protein [Burkholderiales bacterium]|nr:YggT family protein [Burkholderiales bacterium]